MKEMVTLNKNEHRRLVVLNQVEKGKMIGKEVAEILGLPLRHGRRILAVYRKEGAPALVHGNQGRKPYNATEGNLRRQVTGLVHSTHAVCKAQHLDELLTERYRALKFRYKGSF